MRGAPQQSRTLLRCVRIPEQRELREEQIAKLQTKLNMCEKYIIDRDDLVIALKRHLLNSKTKHFNEYQDSLQRLNTTAKQRVEEMTLVQT